MAKFRCGATIARPVDEVFDFFLTPEEHPIDPGIESVVRIPDGPAGPGTTFRYRYKDGRHETTVRFIAVVPNEEIRYEAAVGVVRPTCTLTFDEMNGGTRLSFRADPNPIGPLKLLGPLFNRQGKQLWDQRMERIKAALEAENGQQAV